MENKHTIGDLYQMQSLPLDAKIRMTMARIEGWIREFGEDGVYISFSGGKDSTVLMDIVRNQMGYDIPAVFVDVPTQYPELRNFAKTWENVEILKPKMSFMDVCEKYGFPLISKEVSQKVADVRKESETQGIPYKQTYLYHRNFTTESEYYQKYERFSSEKWAFLLESNFLISQKCCSELKKKPLKMYEKQTQRKPILAIMTEESVLRQTDWIKNGCNAFNIPRPRSNPMSFWTEQDILKYIKETNLPICSVYGDVVIDYDSMGEMDGQVMFDEFLGNIKYKTTGCKRTGCMLCGFGCHTKGDERFLLLKETHPKMYNLLDVVKNNGVTFREAIEWTNEHGNLNIKL